MPMPPSSASRDREFSLQGEPARAWLLDRGVRSSDDPLFRLVADEIRQDGFRLARVWHSAGRLCFEREPDTALLIVQIEGAVDLGDSAGPFRPVQPGEAVLVSCGLDLVARENSARYEIEMPKSTLAPLVAALFAADGRVIDPVAAYRGVLLAVVNAALNGGVTVADPGFPAFRSSVRGLVAALLAEVVRDDRSAVPDSLRLLFLRACERIEEASSDPGFTAAALAQRLGVSPSYLRRACAAHDTTASAQIRSARLRAAREHAHSVGTNGLGRGADVVAIAGFANRRALSRAERAERRSSSAGSTEDSTEAPGPAH